MQRLTVTMAAAAMLLGVSLTATIANAELYNGSAKSGDKCFIKASGWGRDGFGTWQGCPQPAAADVQAHQIRSGKHDHQHHEHTLPASR